MFPAACVPLHHRGIVLQQRLRFPSTPSERMIEPTYATASQKLCGIEQSVGLVCKLKERGPILTLFESTHRPTDRATPLSHGAHGEACVCVCHCFTKARDNGHPTASQKYCP